MEQLVNSLIDGFICLGLVSLIMIPIMGFIICLEKLDYIYNWYDRIINHHSDENE